MAGSADLLRSVRAGGAGAAAAARELVRRAGVGALAPAELREVQKIATAPETKDLFGETGQDLGALTGGGEVFREVKTLAPDRQRLTDSRNMGERFLSDFTLLRGELLGHPGMSGNEQAQRLFAFFELYAERFNELANGNVSQDIQDEVMRLAEPLNEGEWDKALAQFDKALMHTKFNELATSDGRTGLQAAREMLNARTPRAFADAKPSSVSAPGWKDNERAMKAEVDGHRLAAAFDSSAVKIQPQLRTVTTRADETEAAKKDGKSRSKSKDGVLSGRTFWNVLHMMRGDDLDDVARKDAMTQLAIAAGLLLTLGAILVVVLVWT